MRNMRAMVETPKYRMVASSKRAETVFLLVLYGVVSNDVLLS